MNLKHIIPIACACGAFLVTGCTDNSWNDTYLDGFEGGATYDNTTVTVPYTLTRNDYETIGKALYAIAETTEEQDAANAIQKNHYFDESSAYPVSKALPVFLNKTGSEFYIYNVGSHVQVNLQVAEGTPAEIAQISSAPRLVMTNVPTQEEIVEKLSSTYPDALSDFYVVVSYQNTPFVSSSRATSYQAGEFIYTPTKSTRADEVWTVAEGIAQVNNGFKGEATVKGVITEVKDFNSQYGQINYYIADAPGGETIYVYGGLNLDKEKFTSVDQLEVGDNVVIFGNLQDYKGTIEFNYGNYLLSLNDSGSAGGDDDGDGDDNNGGNNPDDDLNYLTSNIKDLEAGELLTATAMVTAAASNGLILTDKAGSIYYYNNNFDQNEYPVGTVVRVSGPVGTYTNCYELNSASTLLAVGEGSYIYPTPEELAGSDFEILWSEMGPIQPIFVTFGAVVTQNISNYVYFSMPGTNVVGLALPTEQIGNSLEVGEYYQMTGYFINSTGSSTTNKIFNVTLTSVEKMNAPIDESDTINLLYVYNGKTWIPAPNATVVNGAAYSQMGFNENELQDPNLYLPNYMKANFPYALPGDEKFVAYNVTATGCACSLLLFDGSQWAVNDNYLEDKVADFVKTDNGYEFKKYLGQEVFNFYDSDEIVLNASYLVVYGQVCMNPVELKSSDTYFGYPGETEVSISDGQIVMTNNFNAFTFTTTCEYDGNVYTAPEGMFMIQDSNGSFMYCNGYSSYNARKMRAYINDDGSISEQYLFTAEKNEDNTWTIKNTSVINGNSQTRILYYSDGNSDFAGYQESDLTKYNGKLPYLYINVENIPKDEDQEVEE